MNIALNLPPTIQICSLEAVRIADTSIYEGVITIEDSGIKNPFRVKDEYTKQLVMCFDDISFAYDEYILPQKKHIIRALEFSDEIGDSSLLIHCHAGVSRSSSIALAILAKKHGEGSETNAVKELVKINPYCRPNKLMTELTDDILNRDGKLVKVVSETI